MSFTTVNPYPSTSFGTGESGQPAGTRGVAHPMPSPTPIVPNAGGGGGGGGGDTPAPKAPTTPPLDWHQYLTDWGFPTDVVDELDRIFRTYSDANQASGAALAYIRGTQWYSQTFPGIQAGIKSGIISDEAGYRAYTNQLNDLYQRYYNTTVSGQDVANALNQGYSVTHVNQHLAGQAYVAANKNDIQFTLGAFDSQGMATNDQLAGYGDTQGGLDNALGTQLTQRYQAALQRLHGIFQGTLATPAGLQLNSAGRLSAPSLSGGIIPGDVQA